MITNSRPTRAEATDCANAVLDGADALMLSGETSVGEFPIESVKMMARIIEKTEADGLHKRPLDGNRKTCLTQAGLLMEGLIWSRTLTAFYSTCAKGDRLVRGLSLLCPR